MPTTPPLPSEPHTLRGGCSCRAIRYTLSIPALAERPIFQYPRPAPAHAVHPATTVVPEQTPDSDLNRTPDDLLTEAKASKVTEVKDSKVTEVKDSKVTEAKASKVTEAKDGSLARYPLMLVCHCNDCRASSGALANACIMCPLAYTQYTLLLQDPWTLHFNNDAGGEFATLSGEQVVAAAVEQGNRLRQASRVREEEGGDGESGSSSARDEKSGSTRDEGGYSSSTRDEKSGLARDEKSGLARDEGGYSTMQGIEGTYLRSFPSARKATVVRLFCGRCGTGAGYAYWPAPAGLVPSVDLWLGTLDREDLLRVRVERHVWWEYGVEWVQRALVSGDGRMLRHPGVDFAVGAEGWGWRER